VLATAFLLGNSARWNTSELAGFRARCRLDMQMSQGMADSRPPESSWMHWDSLFLRGRGIVSHIQLLRGSNARMRSQRLARSAHSSGRPCPPCKGGIELGD
jgi:hypothetical protein